MQDPPKHHTNIETNTFKKVTISFLGINVFVVLLLGLFVFIPIFNSNEELTPVVPQRQIASIKSISGVSEQIFESVSSDMVTIDMNCLEDGSIKKISSNSKQVRLKGKWCGQVGIKGTPHIKNRSGGYEATLFPLKNKGFTSDYITLINGENRIIFTLESPSGESLISELYLTY